MFLCNIHSWNPKVRANLFYGSDKTLGQAIVEKVEAIIASIPQGKLVASIDSDVAPTFFGYGQPPLEVRLIIGGRIISLQVLTEDGLKQRILSCLQERKNQIRKQEVEKIDWELDSFEF